MIQEDYVSFETAKLLKEKGFPQEYDRYYSLVYNEEDYEDEYEVQRMVLQTRIIKAGTLSSYPLNVPDPKCYCPTLQMAMKWLREVHKINIEVCLGFDADSKLGYFYNPVISDLKNMGLGIETPEFDEIEFIVYEEAAEAAIKYCLENLI